MLVIDVEDDGETVGEEDILVFSVHKNLFRQHCSSLLLRGIWTNMELYKGISLIKILVGGNFSEFLFLFWERNGGDNIWKKQICEGVFGKSEEII